LLQQNRIAGGSLAREAGAKSPRRIGLYLVLFQRFAAGSKKKFLANKFGMAFAFFLLRYRN
jgi:hypothetical protein